MTRSILPLMLVLGAALSSPLTLLAADTNAAVPAVSSPAAAVPAETAAPKLPYGVDDVLKLSRAQVSEDIIVNYVQNAGTVYNLQPQDIVYLRNQGVSDRVLTAMLDQRKRMTEVAAAQPAAPDAQAQPAPQQPVTAPLVPSPSAEPAPDYSQPAPVYTEAAPAPSTTYVIPYPAASSAYYGYYSPYYSPYYYSGPTVTFGFGYGGWGHYGHGGYYHGGYYGGGHYGGGHYGGGHYGGSHYGGGHYGGGHYGGGHYGGAHR